MRSGGVATTQDDSEKFDDSSVDMALAMDESGGGERVTLLTGHDDSFVISSQISTLRKDRPYRQLAVLIASVALRRHSFNNVVPVLLQ